MKTEILYYDDIKLLEFDAEIIDMIEENNEVQVILNKTAFYPESGGMSCDVGYLDNCKVIKVIKKNDEIVHILDSKPTNTMVHGKVDAYTRHTNIQIHDAQHLLTGLFEKDYNLITTSHHVHGDYCDLVLEGQELTLDMMVEIERKANELILDKRKLDIFMIPKSDLPKYGLKDNPKYTDPVRMTNIEGLDDYNACGCLHFDNISQIQAVKCLSIEKAGKQNKILFTAGLRMLKLFGDYNDIIKELKVLTKASEDAITDKVQTLLDKNSNLIKELNETKSELYNSILATLINDNNIIIYTSPNDNFDDLKIMANSIINYDKHIKGLLQMKKGDKYQFVIVKQKDMDYALEDLFAVLKKELNVHGGGKGLMITGQSDVDLTSEIEKYI